MYTSNLVSRLLSSQLSRFGLEIVISLVFFSWLPIATQVIATVAVGLVIEVLSVKVAQNSLRKQVADKNWSEILKENE